MTGLRVKLTVFTLVAAVFATAVGTVFAQERHPVCAAKQHDCGTPATIASCCCGDQATPQHSGTPARARVDLSPDVLATPVLTTAAHVLVVPHHVTAADASPPRWCLLDRPTLFGVLLI